MSVTSAVLQSGEVWCPCAPRRPPDSPGLVLSPLTNGGPRMSSGKEKDCLSLVLVSSSLLLLPPPPLPSLSINCSPSPYSSHRAPLFCLILSPSVCRLSYFISHVTICSFLSLFIRLHPFSFTTLFSFFSPLYPDSFSLFFVFYNSFINIVLFLLLVHLPPSFTHSPFRRTKIYFSLFYL